VVIFAPKYPLKTFQELNVIRCNLLVYYRTKPFDFAIVNIFSSQLEKNFASENFDVIHVHHPFWMGSKGLELGKKYGLPVVLTYHTRLEKYSHNLPILKQTFEKGSTASANSFRALEFIKNFRKGLIDIMKPSSA